MMLMLAVAAPPSSGPAEDLAECRRLAALLARQPRRADARLALAEAYHRMGRNALAVEAYRLAEGYGARLGPRHRLHWGRAYAAIGRDFGQVGRRRLPGACAGEIRDDVAVLRPAGKEGTEDVFAVAPEASAVYQLLKAGELREARRELADLWLRRRYWDAAIAGYQRLLEDRPATTLPAKSRDAERAALHERLAQSLLGAGRTDEAIAHIRTAAKLDAKTYRPVRLRMLVEAADGASLRGDLAGTIRALDEAIELSPKDAGLHYRLGCAYYEARQPAAAATEWQMTLQLDPAHPKRVQMLEFLAEPSP